MDRQSEAEKAKALAGLERIKNIRNRTGSGHGINLARPEQTVIQNPFLQAPAQEIRAERGAISTLESPSTPDDSDAPPLEEDQDEQRVERRLLTQQIESVGALQDTQPAEYTDLRRDPVIVLQRLLPEDDIMGLAEKRAKEKGIIILL